MTTDNPQFTSLSIDPSANAHQPTSLADNSARGQKYNTNSGKNGTSFLQSKIFTIVIIAISVGLLIVCICLAIVLAVTAKSTGTMLSTTEAAPTSTQPTTESTTTETTTDGNLPACGIQVIQPEPSLERIYGGTEAVPHSWPWIVLYEEQTSCIDDLCYYTNCGGTLITPQYVLTAAHCIHSTINLTITIYAGLHDKTSNAEDDMRQSRSVEQVFVHGSYVSSTLINDIAILQLSSPFELTDYVRLACLPGTEPQVGDTVIIAGWGAEVFGGETSNVLMQTFTKVVGDCADLWGPTTAEIDETRQICAANIATGASMCPGDSGGPILSKNGDQWIVSGVSSFINVCNTTNNIPNVYTRVAHYLPWIESIIQQPL